MDKEIEEAANNWVTQPVIGTRRESFIAGAKWQSERMYSEEDLHNAFYNGWLYRGEDYSFPKAKKEWLKNLK